MGKHRRRKQCQFCHAHQERASRVREDHIRMGVPKTKRYGNKRKEVLLKKHVKLDEEQEEEKNGNAENCNSGNCCHAGEICPLDNTDLTTVTVIVAP